MIIVKDLHKIYQRGHKEVRAVNGIELEIKRGSSVAIVGPSGAGKSTLLHMLGGLDKPTSGRSCSRIRIFISCRTGRGQ